MRGSVPKQEDCSRQTRAAAGVFSVSAGYVGRLCLEDATSRATIGFWMVGRCWSTLRVLGDTPIEVVFECAVNDLEGHIPDARDAREVIIQQLAKLFTVST